MFHYHENFMHLC